MREDAHFRSGFRLSLVFYAIECLIVILLSAFFRHYSLISVVLIAFYSVTVFSLLYLSVKKKKLKNRTYKIMQMISFVIVNTFTGFAFDSAQVMMYAMILTSVILFAFIDTWLMKVYTVCSFIIQLAYITALGFILQSAQTMREMTFGILACTVANWVFISMTSAIQFKERQNMEQERSLDDLLKIIETKCDDARAATKSKTAFLATMSHEIRTPINAIKGMNEVILREVKQDCIKEYALEARTATESLLGIVNDILDITKIEENKLQLFSVDYKPATLFTDVFNLVKFRAEVKGLKLIFDIDESIPCELFGDDVRIKQILVNLLSNAIKYTHEGTVTFSVKKEDYDIFHFSVKDTGIGIKKENIKRLFKIFERMDEEKNRNIEGTGLGLNITSSLLRLFNSELQVKSEYGKGSEFYFTVRQQVINNTPIGQLVLSEQHHNYTKYTTTFIAPDARILVVDDNAMNRKVFTNLLKPIKIQISEANSGRKCLELVRNNRYDIIFMDHMMPEMDGIETFRIMKEDAQYSLCSETPVVMLTANAVVGAKDMYLNEGFVGLLTKPIDSSRLEEMIYSLLPGRLVKSADTTAKPVPAYTMTELPIIDGIDWRYARMSLGGDKALLDTIKLFTTAMKGDADVLNCYFADITDSDNALKSYRIKVHSMKSSALLIGIISLAGMAMKLEKSAATGDTEIIKAMHGIFIDSWMEYYAPLSSLIKSNGQKKNSADCEDELKKIFESIKTAAENMDVDDLDSLSEQLDAYSYDTRTEQNVAEIKDNIFNFRTDKLKNIEF